MVLSAVDGVHPFFLVGSVGKTKYVNYDDVGVNARFPIPNPDDTVVVCVQDSEEVPRTV